MFLIKSCYKKTSLSESCSSFLENRLVYYRLIYKAFTLLTEKYKIILKLPL